MRTRELKRLLRRFTRATAQFTHSAARAPEPAAMDRNPWAAGFLSGAGSNVDGSAGADSDVMSFYSTMAATTWKDPGMRGGPRYLPYVHSCARSLPIRVAVAGALGNRRAYAHEAAFGAGRTKKAVTRRRDSSRILRTFRTQP